MTASTALKPTGQSLSATRPPGLPSRLTTLIAAMREVDAGSMRMEIPAHLAPTDEDRSTISRLIREIDAAMAPAPMDAMRAAIGSLMAGYSGAQLSREDVEAKAAIFRVALDDVPGWALGAACRAWVRGEGLVAGDNSSFPPAPAQLRRLALAARDPVRMQKIRLQQLLAARPVRERTEAEREAMKARFAALMRPLGQTEPVEAI